METQNKRLIICCDGTWNTPEKPTNVTKMARSISPTSQDGKHQVVFYHQGVGTSNSVDKFAGGLFGVGVEQNVLDAYRFIVHNYQDGDEIFCFGFSRGAYTARALGGMLHAIGLLDKNKLTELPQAYKYYRTPPNKRPKGSYSKNIRPDIKLMAVWDTVGALGAPTPFLKRFTRSLVGFYDTHISPEIKNAYHALAIDEKRGPFQPGLWTGEINPDQYVEQTWFAGVHSDIGGGYADTALSDITFKWMIEKSQTLGLEFSQDYLSNTDKLSPDATGFIHQSYTTAYQWMEKIGMEKGLRTMAGDANNPPINVNVHESVFERMEKLSNYHPQNLDANLAISREDERRHFSRLETQKIDGSIQVDNHSVACHILDYSPLGGVKIQCYGEIKNTKNIVISSGRFAKTLATCVWKKGNTYGLQFAA